MSEPLLLWGMRNPVRGLLHGAAAGLALAGAIVLAVESTTASGRLGLVVFGAGLTALYATSALYHSVSWGPRGMERMQRLDHSMIFVLIAATFTPFAVLTLAGGVRMSALAVAWGLASLGVGAVTRGPVTADRRRVAAMIGLGWLSAVVAVPAGRLLGAEALVLLAAGGAVYSAGGLLFALAWPRLWPRVFSYHELFHALVVVASLLHFTAVYQYLLPLEGS